MNVEKEICRLEDVSSAIERACRPRATFYWRVKNGLMPKFVRVGRRSLVPTHEVSAVLAAEAAGQSDDEIKSLVLRMHQGRVALAAKLATDAGIVS